jgi:hypothetical protein
MLNYGTAELRDVFEQRFEGVCLLNKRANVREGVLSSLSGVRLPREGLLEDDRRLATCQV